MTDYLAMLEKSENGGAPYLQNLQNLEKGGFDGFVGTPHPHTQDCKGGSVGFVGTPIPRSQKSKPAIIDTNPITVQVWTPAGDPVRVRARDQAHADFIKRMNPGPGMVRCADCQRATIANGIARCQAGVDSGLPIQGFWATDRHLCAEFQSAEVQS